MRGSLFLAGFVVFSFGIILSLPTIVLNASASGIQTKGQAFTLIVGNVVKDITHINPQDEGSLNILGRIPSLLIAIGLVLMFISIIVRF